MFGFFSLTYKITLITLLREKRNKTNERKENAHKKNNRLKRQIITRTLTFDYYASCQTSFEKCHLYMDMCDDLCLFSRKQCMNERLQKKTMTKNNKLHERKILINVA